MSVRIALALSASVVLSVVEVRAEESFPGYAGFPILCGALSKPGTGWMAEPVKSAVRDNAAIASCMSAVREKAREEIARACQHEEASLKRDSASAFDEPRSAVADIEWRYLVRCDYIEQEVGEKPAEGFLTLVGALRALNDKTISDEEFAAVAPDLIPRRPCEREDDLPQRLNCIAMRLNFEGHALQNRAEAIGDALGSEDAGLDLAEWERGFLMQRGADALARVACRQLRLAGRGRECATIREGESRERLGTAKEREEARRSEAR